MLTINPAKRITAHEALKHPWVCVSVTVSLACVPDTCLSPKEAASESYFVHFFQDSSCCFAFDAMCGNPAKSVRIACR